MKELSNIDHPVFFDDPDRYSSTIEEAKYSNLVHPNLLRFEFMFGTSWGRVVSDIFLLPIVRILLVVGTGVRHPKHATSGTS